MKKIVYYICLIAIFAVGSCNKKAEWGVPDIKLVPVYMITNIQGNNAPYSLEAYRDKPLLIEFQNAFLAKSFVTSDYADSSNTTDYAISFKKHYETTKTDSNKMINPDMYVIVADKATGNGTLMISKKDSLGNVTKENYTISIAEDQRYN